MLEVSRRALIAGAIGLIASPAAAFWQSRDSNYNLAISGSPPPSGITLVGTATGTTTVTVPAHLPGDLILCFAYRNTTGTPTLPVGFSSPATANETGTTSSGRVGFKTATSTSDTSGTWTNATAMVCHVYRPPSGYTLQLGTIAWNKSTTATVNYPAITLADPTSGNSWCVGFAGTSNTSQTIATAPAGMTNESHETASATQAAGHDTEGGVTSWASTNVTTTGTAGDSISCVVEIVMLPNNAGSSNLANLYQAVPMEGLWASQAITVQNLKIPLPNPSGAGNCVVLCVTYPNGTTLTITDNLDTWSGTPALHANAGSGNMDTAIYVLPDCHAGQRLINIAFSTAASTVQYSVYEFYGIATSSPVFGSSSTAYTAGPSLACGSFTPTSNNSNGGNLILAYYAKADLGSAQAHKPNRIMMLGGFSPVDADIGDMTAGDQTTPHSSALYLQATAAAIDPAASVVGDTDHWNSCAIALALSSGAGTAPQTGIRLNKLISVCGGSLPATASISLQAPFAGNLRVLSNPDPNITFSTIEVTDSEGNKWTADGNDAGFWYFPNASRNDNLVVTVTDYGGDSISSFFFWDISGAATSPFDSSVQTNQTASSPSWTASPGPSPTSTNGITLACIGYGTGPTNDSSGVTAPSGSIFDVPLYTGKTDADTMNNDDMQAHYYYTASGAQTWTFTIGTTTSTDLGGFASFHS